MNCTLFKYLTPIFQSVNWIESFHLHVRCSWQMLSSQDNLEINDVLFFTWDFWHNSNYCKSLHMLNNKATKYSHKKLSSCWLRQCLMQMYLVKCGLKQIIIISFCCKPFEDFESKQFIALKAESSNNITSFVTSHSTETLQKEQKSYNQLNHQSLWLF